MIEGYADDQQDGYCYQEPTNCCASTCCEWTCSKEALYWTSEEDGLSYANKPSNILTTDDFTKTGLVHPNFHWEYGFCLQGGYAPHNSPWSYKIAWTYLASKATAAQYVDSDSPTWLGSFPVWSMAPSTLPGDYVSSSRMRWYLHTNIIDLDVKYAYCGFDNLILSPQIGLRCAILNQKLHVVYEGGSFFSGPDDNLMRNRFLGVGPRVGLNGEYCLGYGFSIRAFAAVAGMYGHYRDSHREEYIETSIFSQSSTSNHLAVSFDYRAGLAWKGKIFSCWPNVDVMISWDGHEFFNQNRMYRGNLGFFKKDRNLTLEGVTLSAFFCF